MRRSGFHFLPLAMFLVLSGCGVDTRETGGVTTITPNIGGFYILLASGLVAIGIGFAIAKKNSYGIGMVIGGVLVAGGMAPSKFVNYVTIEPDRVRMVNGTVWFWLRRHEIRFADVTQVTEESKTRSTRRGGKVTDNYLIFHKSSGEPERVYEDNLVSMAKTQILVAIAGAQVIAANQTPALAMPETPPPPMTSVTSDPLSSPFDPALYLASLEPEATALESPPTPVVKPPALPDVSNPFQPAERPAAQPPVASTFPKSSRIPARTIPAGSVAVTESVAAASDVASSTTSAPEQNDLTVGSKVEARWANAWQPARIVEVLPGGKVRIRYDRFQSESLDEVVPRSRVRLVGQRP